jgi:hypothetical protein
VPTVAGPLGCRGDDSAQGYRCVRDEALLAEELDCVEDDDCPCGSHCILGRCGSACSLDEECEGKICDAFGRCSDESGMLAKLATTSQGLMRVDRLHIELSEESKERRVSVRIADHASGPVRVTAGEGVEVRCSEDGGYSVECEIPGLSPDEQAVVLEVRAIGLLPDGEDVHTEVRVYAGNQRTVVSIRLEGRNIPEPAPRPIGVYSGFIWPIVAGSESRTHVDELPKEMVDIRFPLELQVFAGDADVHPVRVLDAFGALFPSGETNARLVYGPDGSWQMDVPAWHLVGPSSPDADEVEVWVPDVLADTWWSGQHIGGEVKTVFEGATTAEYSPYLIWRLTATWAEELPANATAPTTFESYDPTHGAERASTPLPIEPLVRESLATDLATLTVDGSAAQWAQATMCTTKGEGVPTFLASTILQIDGTDSRAGDLACGEAGSTFAPPTFGLLASNLLRVNENVATCLGDLDQMRLALEGDPDAPLATGGCVAAGRVLTALGHATEPDRARALGDVQPPDLPAGALGQRLLQQWLDMHAFLAREADQVQQLNDILDSESPEMGPVGQDFTVAEAVGTSIEGWDLLLHPRLAVPLAATPTGVLLDPDYREHLYPDETYPDRQSYTQPLGVPASMLDALRADLGVVQSLVDQAQRGQIAEEEVEDLVNKLLRRTFVTVSLAHALHAAAHAAAEPEWEEEWLSARRGAVGHRVHRSSALSGRRR